jgi:hypothetical protein
MMRIYLDACTLNRFTDDQSQLRIRKEAEAMIEIVRLVSVGLVQWTACQILATELLRNTNEVKLREAMGLLDRAGQLTPLSGAAEKRGRELAALGYGYFDALHLACAEEAAVDALLTTDDRFLRKTARNLGNPAIRVMNPIDWLQEAQTWLQRKR